MLKLPLAILVLQTKTGQLFAAVFKGAPLEHVRVEVGREEVRVSRHDMVYEDILATKVGLLHPKLVSG